MMMNESQGDAGQSNKAMTVANMLWCVLGGLLWLLAIIGYVFMLMEKSL